MSHPSSRRPRPHRVAALALAAASCLAASPVIRAQVSANEELDQCMREAAVTGAVTGGAVGGLIGSLLGDRARDRFTRGIGGAAVGATIGAIGAWQLSYKSCSAKFATASSLVTDEYAACARRLGYAREGIMVGIEGESLPAQARGGERVHSDVRYHVLTPDPRDVKVQLTRRFLCRDEQGVFNELSSPTERITISSGCHVSRGGFLLPSQIPAAQDCRMEVSLQAEGQTREHAGSFRIVP